MTSSSRRIRVVAAAVLLFAAVFAGRALDDSATSGITILYLLPVVLVAVEMGRRAGIAASVLAIALFCAWSFFAPVQIALTAYLFRVFVFVLVGAVAGHLADRLHASLEVAQASARHFELTRDLLCTIDAAGIMLHVNGSWKEQLGWTREELTGHPFIALVHPDDRARTEAEGARAAAGIPSADFTNRYRAKDGDWRWIEWSSQLDPDTRLIYAVARDVTDRRRADDARREAEERFRRAFDDSATGMAVIGVAGEERDVVLDANESLSRSFGSTREQLVGSQVLADRVDRAHGPALARGMERLVRGEDAVHRGEYRVERADGTRMWLDLTASLVRDVDGRPRYRLVQVLDVTERKSSEERLRFLADHDPLSGVFNRRRFEQELRRELDHGGRGRHGSVLLLFDVDGFKAINDTLGHATGDAVIARLGDTLRNRLRSSDVVARLGGDEFAALLRRTDVAAAMKAAEGIQTLVSDRLTELVGAELGQVTLSIGVAPIAGPGSAQTPDELLGAADRALYEAKRAGKNRVVLDSGAGSIASGSDGDPGLREAHVHDVPQAG